MDKHELISKLKDLAIELGRTPLYREFKAAVRGAQHQTETKFGSYTLLLQASGLEQEQQKRTQNITNKIFEKDIVTHIENFEPSVKTPHEQIIYTPTVIFGDMHLPFVQQKKLEKSLKYLEVLKPKRIIQIGDFYDMLSHSKFPRSLNTYTPNEEMALGRKGGEAFWKSVFKIVPKAECHLILGNHDYRPMKRIIETYPEAELFLDFEKWFKFDGVNHHMDMRQELIIDGIAYIHGYKSRLGEHMEFMRRPVICGHSHRPGIIYKNYGDDVLWEMNVGYLGDPESKALSYTPQKHTHWSHAIGVINEFGPQVICL